MKLLLQIHIKNASILFLSLFLSYIAYAQLPDCNKYYVMGTNGYFNTVDPVANTSTQNSITLPAGAGGLAVSDNYFAASPSPTFYTVVSNYYYYYNGASWVNTGHTVGSTAAVNPGGAGPYIYNLDGLNAKLYRYDGTGNGTLFLNLGSWSGPYDVMGDSDGNVYLLHTGSPQALNMYDVNGNLVCSYNLVNMPNQNYGGGYSIVNGIVYTQAGSGSYQGTISGTTITFSPITISGGTISDFANCAFPPINLTIADPGVLTCVAGSTTTLSATTTVTSPQYSWTGPGIVSGANTSTPTINQPGVYTLTVTSGGGGCSGTATQQVTVTQSSSLTITGVVTDVSCTNATSPGVDITVSGGTGYTYSWSDGSTNEDLTNVTPGTYTVDVSSTSGCSNTATFTVGTDGTGLVSNISSSSPSFCPGGSSILTASTTSGTSPYTYSWDNGLAAIATNTVNPSSTTTYTCTITDNTGCTGSATSTVTVYTNPTVSAGSDQTVCAGTNITLNGSGASTYTWNNGVPNGVSFTQSVGTTTYIVTGTDINGCTNTDQLNVVVNPLPVVDAGPDQSICTGNQITLTATGATTYTWNNGVTNGTPFTPSLGTTTYTVTGTDSGCSATDQVDVTVYTAPTVSAGVDFVSCENQTIILTGSGANTYTWDNSVVDGVAFAPTQTTTYTVTGTDVSGCTNTDNILVTIIPIPTPDFIADTLIGCSPMTIKFTNNSTGNLTDCVWLFSTGNSDTTCGSVVETFINVGCYDVTLKVTTPEGCSNSMTKANYVCVAPNPLAQFTPNPEELSSQIGTANMINSSTGAINYVWDFGDNSDLSNEVEPSHSFPNSEAATYYITLVAISDGGCSDTVAHPIRVVDDLIFYVPNTFTPDADQYNEKFTPIFTSGFDPYDYSLSIYDRWGEVLFESHNAKIGWDGTYGGKLVGDGTYVWKITFKSSATDKHETHYGNINLLK